MVVETDAAVTTKRMLTVVTATAVALTFAARLTWGLGRATCIESFTLGCLLFPGTPDLTVLSVSSSLSVLVFLVVVFRPQTDSPVVDTNYVVGALDIVVMFVALAWAALLRDGEGDGEGEGNGEAEADEWWAVACPVAACVLVAVGDVYREGLHAPAFVFARCYRYVQVPTHSSIVDVAVRALPVAVAVWPAATSLDFVGLGLVALAALHPILAVVVPWVFGTK